MRWRCVCICIYICIYHVYIYILRWYILHIIYIYHTDMYWLDIHYTHDRRDTIPSGGHWTLEHVYIYIHIVYVYACAVIELDQVKSQDKKIADLRRCGVGAPWAPWYEGLIRAPYVTIAFRLGSKKSTRSIPKFSWLTSQFLHGSCELFLRLHREFYQD